MYLQVSPFHERMIQREGSGTSASAAVRARCSFGPCARGTRDFAAARRRQLYKPGTTKYDDLLPPNYIDLVPKAALEAFKSDSEKFEWNNIPEWVPPKEVR